MPGLLFRVWKGTSKQALEAARAAVDRALANVPLVAKEQAYQAWLGYYKGSLRLLDWTPEKLVQEAAHFAETLGTSCFSCNDIFLAGACQLFI